MGKRPFSYAGKAIAQTTHSEIAVAALLRFAERNAAFSSLLNERLTAFSPADPLDTSFFVISEDDIRQALPNTLAEAEKELEPLLNDAHTRALLQAWSRGRPDEGPRMVIIGIKIGVIPGLTLGQLKIKRHDKMPLVVRNDILANTSATDLGARAVELTGALLAASLEEADGSAQKLEPALADWLFSGRGTEFYQAPPATLAALRANLKTLHIPHVVFEDENGLAWLAVTPALHERHAHLLADLEPAA